MVRISLAFELARRTLRKRFGYVQWLRSRMSTTKLRFRPTESLLPSHSERQLCRARRQWSTPRDRQRASVLRQPASVQTHDR